MKEFTRYLEDDDDILATSNNKSRQLLKERKAMLLTYNIKSRKHLYSILLESVSYSQIKLKAFLSLIFILAIFGLMIAENIDSLNLQNEIMNNIDLIQAVFSRFAILLHCLYCIRSIVMQEGIWKNFEDYFGMNEIDDFMDFEIDRLKVQLSSLIEIDLQKQTVQLQNSELYAKFLSERNTLLTFQIEENTSSSKLFSVYEAVYQFLGYVSKIVNSAKADIVSTNTDVIFVFENGYGSFFTQMRDAYYFYIDTFVEFLETINSNVLWFLITVSVIIGIIYPSIIWTTNFTENECKNLIKMFLNIPSKYLESLKEGSEEFLFSLNVRFSGLNKTKKEDFDSLIGTSNSSEGPGLIHSQVFSMLVHIKQIIINKEKTFHFKKILSIVFNCVPISERFNFGWIFSDELSPFYIHKR